MTKLLAFALFSCKFPRSWTKKKGGRVSQSLILFFPRKKPKRFHYQCVCATVPWRCGELLRCLWRMRPRYECVMRALWLRSTPFWDVSLFLLFFCFWRWNLTSSGVWMLRRLWRLSGQSELPKWIDWIHLVSKQLHSNGLRSLATMRSSQSRERSLSQLPFGLFSLHLFRPQLESNQLSTIENEGHLVNREGKKKKKEKTISTSNSLIEDKLI